MATRPDRRFRIRDLLVLTAAVAAGMLWMRSFKDTEAGGESYPWYDEADMRRIPAIRRGLEVADWWMVCASYVVAPVAIALAGLIAWGTPRPRRWRTATRRPGAVAGGAVLLTVALDLATAATEILDRATSGEPYDSIWQLSYLTLRTNNAAVAVAAAWAVLAVGGRWRREPGWLDAAGIALGAYWLLLFGLDWGLRNVPAGGVPGGAAFR